MATAPLGTTRGLPMTAGPSVGPGPNVPISLRHTHMAPPPPMSSHHHHHHHTSVAAPITVMMSVPPPSTVAMGGPRMAPPPPPPPPVIHQHGLANGTMAIHHHGTNVHQHHAHHHHHHQQPQQQQQQQQQHPQPPHHHHHHHNPLSLNGLPQGAPPLSSTASTVPPSVTMGGPPSFSSHHAAAPQFRRPPPTPQQGTPTNGFYQVPMTSHHSHNIPLTSTPSSLVTMPHPPSTHPQQQASPSISIGSQSSSSANSCKNKEKTPMCLINELARFNKTIHQYRLTDEAGPAHKKTFSVCLKLGEDEEYLASGQSIKKAQHAAAAIALERTQLKHPPVKTKSVKHVNVTPTVELNAFAMKQGEQVSYSFIDQPKTNYSKAPMNLNFRGIYTQRYHSQSGKNTSPQFNVCLKVGSREFYGEGPTAQMAKHVAAGKALKTLKESRHFDSAMSPVSQNGSVTSLGGTRHVALNPASLPFIPGSSPGAAAVAAAAAAASAAAAVVSSSSTVVSVASSVSSSVGGSSELDDLKSPISLVHESALKRNLTVSFEVIQETGPPHMRTFITKCIVGDVVTSGEGNGKKASKKRAAELMIDQLKQLPPLASYPAAKPKKPSPTKKKSRNLIKVDQKENPEYGGLTINPISRLIQIQQAKREKEPVYTLVAERGVPRRRDFVMQVAVGSQVARGNGPNKKLAKRAAAENLLQTMGYSRPQPQPSKPALKMTNSGDSTHSHESVSTNGSSGKVRKLTFVDEVPSTEQNGCVEDVEGPLVVSLTNGTSTPANGKQSKVPGLIYLEKTTSSTASISATSSASSTLSIASSNGSSMNGTKSQDSKSSGYSSSGSSSVTTPIVVSASVPIHNQKSQDDSPNGKSAHNQLSTSQNKSEINQNGCKMIQVNPNGVVQPKDQLAYLAKVLGVTVTYQDFPKKNNKSEFFSLVSLSTDPPQVSHGTGSSVEESHNAAAAQAMMALADSGVECSGSPSSTSDSPQKKANTSDKAKSDSSSPTPSPATVSVKNGVTTASPTSLGRTLVSLNAKKKKAKEEKTDVEIKEKNSSPPIVSVASK
ncbi:double-stranded RNA-binding protein Staufen homolog isoform X2 [Tigriopus californicus]|nr:double-stranded RNA-binding protein Staufen homolog isoform X2 [Tigriopus californicus]XP_059099278.1 double-stranded RNA-binding protein Staufen homolog isoform X2 [Tigriopus californicus]